MCDICGLTFPKLDKHHIVSKRYGGTNAAYNLCNICPNCHRLIHSGEIVIEGKYMTSQGIKVVYRDKNSDTITNSLPKVHII